MILIVGIPSEPPVSLVTDAAQEAGIEYVMLNQREMHLHDLFLELKDNRLQCVLKMNGLEYDIDEFNGIYLRMMEHFLLPEMQDRQFHYIGDEAAAKSAEMHTMLLHYFEVARGRVFNTPRDMMSNLSKPFQAFLITEAGFRTPPTLISSALPKVKGFLRSKKRVIYKSISSVRSVVREVDGLWHSLGKIRYLPVQFQKKLDGENIRVHVVGDALFATKVICEAVDYRYASNENKDCELAPVDLPDAIAEKCFKLSKVLRLPFCGIDLFKTVQNRYYCFEVNPCAGYSYYQQTTGQNISGAIVRWLEFGTAK